MSNRRDNYPGPIPNRWIKCPIKSESVICEKFLAFKTPLDKKFDGQVFENSFYPEMLFKYMKDIYKKKIGLWIDLTNTNRFYSRSDVEKRDCQYVKLQCRGFGETPSTEQVRSFIEIVEEFTISHPLDIIAVHCTHGFNRTGFLITSFLVEKFDYDIAAALQTFANARPPGIYKQEYINELFKRYGDEDDDVPPAPELPDWCHEEEESADDYHFPAEPQQQQQSNSRKRRHHEEVKNQEPDNDEDNDNNDDESQGSSTTGEGSSRKKRRKENIRLDATFMPGVPGVELMTDKNLVNSLQHMIQDMCNFRNSGFPGCQPISMDRSNIKLLHVKPYQVSWKADGTRYMMLIKKEHEIYFFDRDNSCFKVENVTFPLFNDVNNHLENTLLDGEMVVDEHHGQKFPRYLVYDIVCFDNENVGCKTFTNRMNIIKEKIIGARVEALKQGLIVREREPFGIRTKDFWDVTQAKSLLSEKFAKQLLHEPDGLIFQPQLEPYVCGRCDEVLKWKPSEQNSVDFLLRIAQESGLGMLTTRKAFLFVGGLTTPFAEMRYNAKLKDLNNKIVECKFEDNTWKFMRVRNDKSYPNAYSTAMAVCKSIQEPVTKDMLLNYINKFRYKDEDSDHFAVPHAR